MGRCSIATTTELGDSRHVLVTQRLRERRRALGFTQRQVVSRLATLGVHTTNKALSCLEHGTGLDVAKLPELATALDCTTTYLLGLTTDPHRWHPDETSQVPHDAEPSETHTPDGYGPHILGPNVPVNPARAWTHRSAGVS